MGMPTITRLQWLVWIAVFLILFFSILPEGGFMHALCYTLINISFYSIVIYGNISLLFPRLYLKGYRVVYVICVIFLLAVSGLSRGYLIISLSNYYYPSMQEQMNLETVINFIVAGFFLLLIVLIFALRKKVIVPLIQNAIISKVYE